MKKIMKTFISSIIIFAIGINTFAVEISANDGSAFITKAEFDSLKNNFQTQIDSYNTGIDSKIDTAISSYLSGIKIANEGNISLLFPVGTTTSNKPIMVPNKQNTIKKQTFQGGIYNNSLWATYAYVPALANMKPYTDGASKYNNWTELPLLGKAVYDQMEGWTFDATNPTVLLHKYGYDNCKLILSQTSTQNQNYMDGGTGDRWLMGVAPGTFDGKYISTTYTSFTGIGNGSSHWGCGTQASWLVDSDDIPENATRLNWCDVLPIDSTFASKYALRQNSSSYDETIHACFYLVTHSTSGEDNNIYLYSKCEDVIYAHETSATLLEEYVDRTHDVALADIIGGKTTNLYRTGRITNWAWWNNFTTDASKVIGPRRNWRFTPKFKLKNTYVAPDTPSTTGGQKYWNTLKQFKNGKLKYVDHSNSTAYPNFYGGLPLMNVAEEYEYVTFDIKISNTIGSGTEICLQVSSEEFPNENVLASFPAAKKNALKEISGTAGATTYTYDNTNKYLKIPVNQLVTVKLEEPDKDKTYFIRWWESGNADFAGGQVDTLESGKYKIKK